jgi:hypothetical protein
VPSIKNLVLDSANSINLASGRLRSECANPVEAGCVQDPSAGCVFRDGFAKAVPTGDRWLQSSPGRGSTETFMRTADAGLGTRYLANYARRDPLLPQS